MEIPNHECDKCGDEGSRYHILNCLCDDCLQKVLSEAEQEGKDSVPKEMSKKREEIQKICLCGQYLELGETPIDCNRKSDEHYIRLMEANKTPQEPNQEPNCWICHKPTEEGQTLATIHTGCMALVTRNEEKPEEPSQVQEKICEHSIPACEKCFRKQLSQENWEKGFEEIVMPLDKMWADQIKDEEIERWRIMYGFTPRQLREKVKDFIRQQIQTAEANAIKTTSDRLNKYCEEKVREALNERIKCVVDDCDSTANLAMTLCIKHWDDRMVELRQEGKQARSQALDEVVEILRKLEMSNVQDTENSTWEYGYDKAISDTIEAIKNLKTNPTGK